MRKEKWEREETPGKSMRSSAQFAYFLPLRRDKWPKHHSLDPARRTDHDILPISFHENKKERIISKRDCHRPSRI